MYCIRYASRVVSDPRPDAAIRTARIKKSVAWYEELNDAFRQAVTDTYFGKTVLGMEQHKTQPNMLNEYGVIPPGKVVVDAVSLHAAAEKFKNAVEMHEAAGMGSKRARQAAIREVKRG
jgi:catechol 2,3-dioxygenase-like lactoylglutathione lyase family enzyme